MPEPATPNNDAAHAHALALAALGLKVLPIRPGTKVPCGTAIAAPSVDTNGTVDVRAPAPLPRPGA